MIYIFAGDFNPPHSGHSSIIRAILHFQNPEKIIIIPSNQNNTKYQIPDFHRLKMLEIFVADLRDNRVEIDDFFIWWEKSKNQIFDYCNEKYGENIYYIFGTDEILENQNFSFQNFKKILIPRIGYNLDDAILKNLKNSEILEKSHFPEISSSHIRSIIPDYTDVARLYDDNLKKFKIPWLSEKISLYILENRLYRQHLPKQKVLVHVCCGPDVVMPILQLKDEYDLICFWYDPNIQPKKEYDKRYEAFKKVCEIENIAFIKGAYDVKNFFGRIKWYEFTPEKTGEKCTRCYDMRMYVSAKLARRLGIKLYTTSLNTSPKKDLEKMFFMGHKYADEFGLKFLDIPFRKRWWFAISAEYTKEHDIYRQNYCGCVYSIREGGDSDMKRKIVG